MLREAHPQVRVGFDLADLSGYAYYSGARFAVYAAGASDALVRGGRYDEVGAVFGRNRPAVGFSLDVKELVAAGRRAPLHARAIRAPVAAKTPRCAPPFAALREQGETVVCVLPGPRAAKSQEFDCDRELVEDRQPMGRAQRSESRRRPCIRRESHERHDERHAAATWSSSAPSGATRARARSSTG